MADNETKIGIETEINAKSNASKVFEKDAQSINKVIDNLSDLQKNITSTIEVAEKLAMVVDKIAAKSIHVTNQDYRQNTIQVGKAKVAWNSESELSDKRTEQARENVNKLLEEQAKLLEQQNIYYKENLQIQKNEAIALKQRSHAKELNAKANLISAPAYVKRQDALDGWLRYRSANPEKFLAARYNTRYQIGNGIANAGQSFSKFGDTGKILGGVTSVIGNFVKTPALGFAAAIKVGTDAITNFSKAAVTAYGEIESTKTQLGVVYGNQSQASGAFNELAQYAIKSPFGIEQTSELAILLKQSGVYASDLMDTLKMIGDTAGGNMEKMKRVANNYAQIVSIGKASMLDMRQFAYAGIPIFEAVSKELGVSQQRLRKLISDGQVTSDIIEKVFKDLTGVNGIFENATEKGANTLKARLQNLKDSRQLMFSEFGDSIVNLGATGSSDSYVKNGVSWIENLFQKLQKWQAINNIERDVKDISERNSDIKMLQDLIQYNKANGNKDEVKRLEKQLNELLKRRDLDKERATLANAYEERLSLQEKYGEKVSGNKESDLIKTNKEIALSSLSQTTSLIPFFMSIIGSIPLTLIQQILKSSGIKSLENQSTSSENVLSFIKEFNEMAKDIRKENRELKRYAKNGYGPTDEMSLANAEQYVQKQQDLAATNLSKYQDDKNSAYKISQDIIAAYEDSDEYKEEQQKKQLAEWEKTQNLLKDLKSLLAENNKVDLSKLTLAQFNEFYRSGAISAEKKLATTGDNPSMFSEDRDELQKNIEWGVEAINKSLSNAFGISGTEKNNLQLLLNGMTGLENLNDKDFLDNFNRNFEAFGSTIDDYISKDSTNSDTANYLRSLKNILSSMLFSYRGNTEAADLPLVTNKSKGQGEFIALWRRLLASATGISSNVIHNTKDTLTNYRDDMAVRNMSKNFTSAYLSSGGSFESIQKMLSPSGRLMNIREGGETYQIDWKQVRTNIRDFSLSLSASTDAIKAYKSSLEAEYNTYIQLAQSLSEAESQDLKNQKNVTAGQMEKLIQDQGSQLINAFGEKLETEDGMKVSVKQMEDGSVKFLDEDGNELAKDQVVLNGNIFEFLKDQIPAIRNQIAQANKSEAYNKIFNKITSTVAEPYLREQLLKSSHAGMTSYSTLTDEMQDILLETLEKNLKTSPLIGADKMFKSVEDMLITAVTGNDSETEYLYAINQIRVFADEIMKSSETLNKFSNLMDKYNEAESKTIATKNIQHVLANSNTKLKDYFPTSYDNNVLRNNYWTNPLLDTLGLDRTSWEKMLNEYRDLEDIESSSNLKELTKYVNLFKNSDKESWKDLDRFGIANKIKDSYKVLGNLYGGNSNEMMDKLTYAGYSSEKYEKIMTEINSSDTSDIDRETALNQLYERRMAILDEMVQKQAELNEKELSSKLINEATANKVKELANNMLDLSIITGKKMFTSPFETIGKCLVTGEDAATELKSSLRGVAAEMLSSMGSYMAEAGFSLVTLGAKKGNIGIALAGLGLAAAGGFASGLGGALANAQNETSDKDEAQKLQSLQDRLAELLEQARSDALYYENNLRHKTALGINKQFSNKSVNDAIIAPNGNIITTAPDDYLIATKTPGALANNQNVTVQPKINFTVIDNSTSGAKVAVEQQQNSDGSIDFIAKVYDAMDSYIATSRSDDAFAARQYRINGRQAIR